MCIFSAIFLVFTFLYIAAMPHTRSTAVDESTQSAQPSLGEIKADIKTLCTKIDGLHEETTAMHRKLSDFETALTDTSERTHHIENVQIPKLHEEFKSEIAALNNKLLLMEVYQRKSNLLFYGVRQDRDENVYTKLRGLFVDLGIPREDAAAIIIVNAHRLPRKAPAGAAARDPTPDPIIAKFAIMSDRNRILDHYDNKSRNRESDHVTNRGANSGARISVRTDLPPIMKAQRGKLAAVAFSLRKEKNQSTKIVVKGTAVILQFKEKGTKEWRTYKD